MRLIIGFLLGLGFASVASALPMATYQESLGGSCQFSDSATGVDDAIPENLGLDLTFDHFSGNCQMVGNVFLTGSVQPAIDIQLSARAESISANIAADGSGTGRIQYYFQVAGPADTVVPLDVYAAVSISGSRTGRFASTKAVGSGAISGLPGGESISFCAYWGSPSGACSGVPEGGGEQILSYTTLVQANQSFLITLSGVGSVAALGDYLLDERGEVQVIVDPVFSFVNPEDAVLYSLEFSPNMSPVPIPATVTLLPSGLLVALAWARRRRKIVRTI